MDQSRFDVLVRRVSAVCRRDILQLTGALASAPVVGEQRIRSLDIIRGVAVFGLMWVNLGLYGPDLAGPQAVPGAPGSSADLPATWVTWTLAAGKFFSQFSILFGLSLAMQLERAAARGQRIGGLWIRRMLVLFTIGWANAILFWPGDDAREQPLPPLERWQSGKTTRDRCALSPDEGPRTAITRRVSRSRRLRTMKRVLGPMIVSSLAVSLVTAQGPAKGAPQHYRVAAAEAPDPRVTPDGRYRFDTEADGEGNEQLSVRDLTTGENRRLTQGPGEASDAFMSPDGKQIAYAWTTEDRPIELRIVATDGSEPRLLYSNRDVLLLWLHEWSPDGKHVAATLFQKDRTSQLVLISVAGDSVRVLRTQPLETLNANFQWNRMNFSPGGRFVAYDLSPQGGWHPRDIFAIPVAGGPEVPLVEHPANDLLLGWSPEGRGVLFASDRSGHWDLWVIEVSDGRPRGSPVLVKSNFGSLIDGLWFTSLGFTRDGSYYYKAWLGEIDLYLATFDPATNRLGSPTKLASHVGYRSSPAWSRDGRYLAHAWGRGTAYEPFILGIRSAQTGEERELRLDTLIRHGGHGFDPRWSPDGRFILADARERDYAGPLMDSQGLYRIDVRTGSVTPLVQTTAAIAGIDSPAWSPDGRVIFERRPPLGDRSRIVARDLETGEEKELYRAVPPAKVHHWPTSNTAVSPNGQRLAFVWTDGKTVDRATALMVLPTAGGEPRELVRAQDPAVVSVPAWTPDSRYIMYARSVSGEKRKFELWRISADGGRPQKLGLVMEGLEPYGLSVHPDGKRIAFTAGTAREEVWVLKDFLPVRRARERIPTGDSVVTK